MGRCRAIEKSDYVSQVIPKEDVIIPVLGKTMLVYMLL